MASIWKEMLIKYIEIYCQASSTEWLLNRWKLKDMMWESGEHQVGSRWDFDCPKV